MAQASATLHCKDCQALLAGREILILALVPPSNLHLAVKEGKEDQVPREYQRELFLSAMRGNTLVYLPTGSGKTLIAAMVLSCMKQLNPNKLMVFVVDRVPLAYQQSDYIKSQVPDLRVETLVGEMESALHQKNIHQSLADNKVDVLVLTHQILLNFLAEVENAPTRLSDISVLVLDEAHHCSGKHRYNEIMKYYREITNEFKPVVLGLTASPAGEVTVERTSAKLDKLLDNLSCTIAMPVESDVVHVNTPDTFYDVSSSVNTRQVRLKRCIEDHIVFLINDAPGCEALQGLPLFSPNFRGALRRLIDRCHGDKRKIKAVIVGEYVMHMLSVVDLSEVLGYKHAMQCLKECVYRTIHAVSPKESALKKWIGRHHTFTALKDLADSAVEEHTPVSDRYNRLVHHVRSFLSRAQDDETSRGIVFVSMRKTAFKVCEQIRTIPEVAERLNPQPFVGHGRGSYEGMAWKDEQEVLLKKFRSGVTKLLICTSVLEEGLDVPECNLVVRFEGAATLRALVQSRGRASRRSDSKFVVICNEKEENDSKDLLLKEQNMEEAIGRLMVNKTPRSQAEEFGCEVKKPNFLYSEANENGENIPIERYNPRITVSVYNLVGMKSRVIDFLNNNFDVMSSKAVQSTSMPSEATVKTPTSQQVDRFELQANEDKGHQEFRSQEEFTRHVTEVWCSRLTNREEEPLPVWLQPSLPKKRRRASEPFHWLTANSLFLGSFVHRCHFRFEWPLEPILKNVQIKFDHSLKILTVYWSTQGNLYKFELRYDELEDFILVDSDVDAEMNKLFITTRHPPRLYQAASNDVLQDEDVNDGIQEDQDVQDVNEQQDEDDGLSDSLDDRSDSESDDSFSTDEEYPDVVRNFRDRSSPDLPDNDDDDVTWERVSDIRNSENAWSQCFTYCFAIPSRESLNLMRLLTTIERRFDKKASYCRVKESYGRFPDVDIPTDLPFDVKYAAQSVISFHPVIRGRVEPGSFGNLLQSNPSNVVTAALEKLKKALEQDKFCDPSKTLQALLNQNRPSSSEIHNRLVPSHCALIKRAVITPTRLLLYPLEVMVKNRVLRHYETDDFLCVSIRDEDLSKLSAAGGSVDLILDDVKRALDEGLGIAGQRFHFLGSSNSQLRNHSCWFVGPSSQPVEHIRCWMGDFRTIKCVASYMARMGQCFSTSMDTVGIAISEGSFCNEVNDVETADHKYCFSDGIGKISEELAKEVVKKIAKPFKPSAFQIRFAGNKGVLALDPSLSGKQASFRPSMHKFESFHRRLEVLQTSRAQAVYLNHQVIMLLSNLGVPDEVFIKLQSDMLERLAAMLVNEPDAVDLLGNGAKMGVSYHRLSGAGVPLTTEPFFKSLLVAMYRNSIHELLSRARIRLSPAEARLMMGVMDESGVLKPGQVFVQYSAVSTLADREDEFNRNSKLVLRGPVVVTRNPCLHPGDVRQLEARKPLPRKPNFPPMDYQAHPKKEQDEPITAEDMTKFVVDYIRSDQLGVIDNAHKALADVEKGGVESQICLHLAELHSLAVDAPKTGRWPKMPKMRPIKNYPDFMMKSDKASYPSEKLLGKLYRRCRKFKDAASERYSQKMRVDKSFMLPGHDRYVKKAQEVYQQYRDKMEALMRLYGIDTEAEAFTGCFLRLRNRLRKEKTEIAEIVSERLFALRSDFRREFFREFGKDGQCLVDNALISNEMLLKASAWYTVAYTHAHDQADDPDPVPEKRLLGFPWFINDVMLAIKERQKPLGLGQGLDVKASVGKHSSNLSGLPVVPPEEDDISIEDQAKSLQQLSLHLKDTELFSKVRLVNKKHFPVLVCKRPSDELTAGGSCSSTLSCDLSSSPNSLPVAILLSSYMKSYPHLLLVLRAVHRWCCVTGLSRNAAGAGNMSNLLTSLLLAQCMRKGRIQKCTEEFVTTKKLQLLLGDVTDGTQYMEWENIIRFLDEASSDNPNDPHLPQAEVGTTQLELLDKEHLLLVKEHMQRGYQLLALYGDVQIMLAISGSEDYNVIFLSPLLSSFMAGIEKSRAQEIARKTGATSIVIRPSFSRSRTSAILEVKGSEPAIRAVERELERMTTQASRDRVSLMSGCFVEDASLLLFEGSRNQNDHVTLTPYDGPCHQTHDNLPRHVALLNEAVCNEYAFRRFTEKFFQQLRVLERDFDSQLHGCREFSVHFGRIYMFCVPHSLLEDIDSITIAKLRANKRKPRDPQNNRRAPRSVTYVDQEEERARRRKRRPKRAVNTDENRKKRKRENPSRSSFYTVVHSPDRVKTFLDRCGFQPDTNPTEQYSIDICDEGVEFYVRFDSNFNFIEVKFPNLRWCMVDVKRPWQQRPSHDVRQDGGQADDDVILDGWETDVRFLLQSRCVLGPSDIPGTKYARYQRILEPGNHVQPFTVQEDLWKDVKLVRYSKVTKFTRQLPPRGYLSGLAVHLGEVTEYSRPLQGVAEFGREVTRWEASLEATLPTDLTVKETMKKFLHEVWEFAFSMSSFVSLVPTED
ncbi:hypothetical protein OS493_030827 [Desmophyllum pertusum]|uniref:RNA-directed RNA polymerase n=1 Tax=Desmophyllum pertusum TaxID=174260 RepID=A0A9W9YJV2_9CNID|nr:hypothetical protein OS493_030827 [Desmophyllum pertusum]